MTLQEQLLLAADISAMGHDGVRRKDDRPYFLHPVRVAIRCETIETKIVALLHDLVEDTYWTLDDLLVAGFDEGIVAAVDSVTKRPNSGETYMEFCARAKANPIGRIVKIADIEDNMSDMRGLDAEEREFLTKRYSKALTFLREDVT
jgi:(p)ppGpp synthase/HD superfamily hydrolase